MRNFKRNSHRVITIGDKEEIILNEFNQINSDNEILIVQIFAHGGQQGIQRRGEEIITWPILVNAINPIRTTHPVRLDLCGVCESYHIQPHLNQEVLIDSIWVTNQKTSWQSVYSHSREANTFIEFLDGLAEEDENAKYRDYYLELVRPNFEIN